MNYADVLESYMIAEEGFKDKIKAGINKLREKNEENVKKSKEKEVENNFKYAIGILREAMMRYRINTKYIRFSHDKEYIYMKYNTKETPQQEQFKIEKALSNICNKCNIKIEKSNDGEYKVVKFLNVFESRLVRDYDNMLIMLGIMGNQH